MLRIIIAPLILVLAALSFPALDKYRRAHWYGWLSPAMDEHWKRLFATRPFDGEFYHAAKNVMSEWVRLDPQRAGKIFSFLLTISMLLNVVLIYERIG